MSNWEEKFNKVLTEGKKERLDEATGIRNMEIVHIEKPDSVVCLVDGKDVSGQQTDEAAISAAIFMFHSIGKKLGIKVRESSEERLNESDSTIAKLKQCVVDFKNLPDEASHEVVSDFFEDKVLPLLRKL